MDPLLETLDSATWVSSQGFLPELEPIVVALRREGGVTNVGVGRRADEKHTVAQVLRRSEQTCACMHTSPLPPPSADTG